MPDNVRTVDDADGSFIPSFQNPMNTFMSNQQRLLKQEDTMRQYMGYSYNQQQSTEQANNQ